jgi:hypothetical protein
MERTNRHTKIVTLGITVDPELARHAEYTDLRRSRKT